MMIQEFIRLFSMQELKKVKKSGRFSLDNSKSATPSDRNELESNTFERKETNTNLRKHLTLQNMEDKYLEAIVQKNNFK